MAALQLRAEGDYLFVGGVVHYGRQRFLVALAIDQAGAVVRCVVDPPAPDRGFWRYVAGQMRARQAGSTDAVMARRWGEAALRLSQQPTIAIKDGAS